MKKEGTVKHGDFRSYTHERHTYTHLLGENRYCFKAAILEDHVAYVSGFLISWVYGAYIKSLMLYNLFRELYTTYRIEKHLYREQ